MRRKDFGWNPYLALAQVRAIEGRSQEAIGFLHAAIEKGFLSYPWLRLDPVFQRLEGTPDFAQTVLTLEQRVRTISATRPHSSKRQQA